MYHFKSASFRNAVDRLGRLLAFTAFLLFTVRSDIRADDNHDALAAICQRYLLAQGDEQQELAARIDAFDGEISKVLDILSKPLASDRQDVSGVLTSQRFTHPELKQAHPEDLLHYFVPEDYQPAWKETRDDFEKQSFRTEPRRVEAGLVDATIQGDNRIDVRTENVSRFSIWLHPSKIDLSPPVRVTVNGKEGEHKAKGRLLDVLRSYRRRHDWRLVYHAEIMVQVSD